MMKGIIKYTIAMVAMLALSHTADAEMRASIEVSGGGTYDYVTIGMLNSASDGFDNAYDTMSPTGTLSDAYIEAFIGHPEWGRVKEKFRGDIRSTKSRRQEWTVGVNTNLPAGTMLKVGLKEGTVLPDGARLMLEDVDTGQKVNLSKTEGYEFAVSPNQKTRHFKITGVDRSIRKDGITRTPVK